MDKIEINRDELVDLALTLCNIESPAGQEGAAGLIAQTLGVEEVSAAVAQLVYRTTEGNAFFTQEVVRALSERGDLSRQNGAWERTAVESMSSSRRFTSRPIPDAMERIEARDRSCELYMASCNSQNFPCFCAARAALAAKSACGWKSSGNCLKMSLTCVG